MSQQWCIDCGRILLHEFRVDMERLVWIDEWVCVACSVVQTVITRPEPVG